MVVVNVTATRLQADGIDHVNQKKGEEKQVALHFDGTELTIVYDGWRRSTQRPMKWKYNKIKLIPTETMSGFDHDTLQSDGLMLWYKAPRDKRLEIQRLLKAPMQPSSSSSSSSSSGKTKENVNRQTPSTGSTSSSHHQRKKANMISKPNAVLQHQQPISVTKSATVSRDGHSSSSAGMGTYLHRNPSHDILTSPLVDRHQQEDDESDYERAIKGEPLLLHQRNNPLPHQPWNHIFDRFISACS